MPANPTPSSSNAQNEPLTAALAYARRGWAVFPLHSIISGRCSCGKDPCRDAGKHPHTTHGLTDATTDEGQIRRWWQAWPEANIGIRTGAGSGIFVLDAEASALDTIEEWQQEHGLFPTTPMVRTGGGGLHVYFAHPGVGRIKTAAGQLVTGIGIDTRGDGGYAVAPPSNHLSGDHYTWLDGIITPALAPPWLLTRVLASAPPSNGSHDEEEPILAGGRNDALASIAGRMRYAGLTPDEIALALKRVNRERCNPPLDEDEVETIARSIGRYAPPSLSPPSPNGFHEPVDMPPFPIEILPPAIREYVEQCAAALPVPHEMVAMPMLGMVGALAGNRICLRLKASWHEYLSLYVVAIASPGTGKTAALTMAEWPLKQLQKDEIKDYKRKLATYDEAFTRWKDLPKDQRGDEPQKPGRRDYYTTDITMESIAPLMDHTPGLSYIGDEVTSWIERMNQYRKGGDRQQYMMIWSSRMIKVDRRTAGSYIVERPVMSVIGGIQPSIVPSLYAEARNDGFVQRLLPYIPTLSAKTWNSKDVSDSAYADVAHLYRQIDALPMPKDDDPIEVNLSTEARAAWGTWYDENSVLAIHADSILGGFYTKLEAHVARFALILHILANPTDPRIMITEATMHAAIELGEWCRAHIHQFVPLLGTPVAAEESQAGAWPRIRNCFRREIEKYFKESHEGNGHIPQNDAENPILDSLIPPVWLSKDFLLRATRIKTEVLTNELDSCEKKGLMERRVVSTASKPRTEYRLISEDDSSPYFSKLVGSEESRNQTISADAPPW